MEIVPVLDIRHGQVVRAVAGDRDAYQPMQSPLCPTSLPRDVAKAFGSLWPFTSLYIADLDAIQRNPAFDNRRHVADILVATTARDVWLDAGMRSLSDIQNGVVSPRIWPVVGSETGITADELLSLSDALDKRFILSLDFRETMFVGHGSLLEVPECWPRCIIAMTLARVGTDSGPDLALITRLAQVHMGGVVYAAGGLRTAADLLAAQDAGAAGALVSSALHAQTITADDLGKVTGRQS